ncbi:hypothetical protein KM914_14145 [Virgibacillus pantothenticus]|nr:hypothetical protein [Virgibacillus pantothenticus]MBU8567561.1 hypothetical protein [Virgibacillus pantothenticus]MBU8601349.1 hypothetical protein [Virgibacillus pantothenticus]MBU8636166.1 hypothetical protein [Virgibacillus pantothenticus]MBU8643686.1 hypothetical protein [Virgibacillus pantothenticus]MBU8648058.1 hypothetical protein [Virgibacillus pantothenticus]
MSPNDFFAKKIGNKEAVTSTYNIQNQLTAYGKETIKYDQNGNRIEDGTYTYEWNAADQLVAVTKKGEVLRLQNTNMMTTGEESKRK